MEIKLLSSDAVEPTRAYKYSAGYDMYAAETVVLKPQEKAIIRLILLQTFRMVMLDYLQVAVVSVARHTLLLSWGK